MSRKIQFWMLPLVLLLFSWSSVDPNNANSLDEATTTNQLILMVNNYRESIGKPLLIRNATADKLAAEHASYMVSNKDVSTDNFETRWEALELKENAQEVSENVGVDISAEKAMNAYLSRVWLKSNVEGNYTHTGIAVKKDTDGRYFYTQIFYNK